LEWIIWIKISKIKWWMIKYSSNHITCNKMHKLREINNLRMKYKVKGNHHLRLKIFWVKDLITNWIREILLNLNLIIGIIIIEFYMFQILKFMRYLHSQVKPSYFLELLKTIKGFMIKTSNMFIINMLFWNNFYWKKRG
jgi:hypothetical protein